MAYPVYFFERTELLRIFQAQPSEKDSTEDDTVEYPALPGPPLYRTIQLAEDRRMLVNRRERKRMFRVWLQAKLVKN